MKDVTVGEHGKERREEPGRAARGDGHESEDAPEEEEDAEGDGDFFSGGDAEEIGERKEQEIEKDVVPLPDGVDAGGSSLLDELGKPGVVDVAAEITGFDVGMPEDGNEKEGGEKDDSRLHRIAESIARVGKEKECKSEEHWSEERLEWWRDSSGACRKWRGTSAGMTCSSNAGFVLEMGKKVKKSGT